MRVGETAPTEIRHRVRLAPDHIVQDPETKVLQYRADPIDIVIASITQIPPSSFSTRRIAVSQSREN